MSKIHIWYFPSNYGDIRLEAVGDDKTRVLWFQLTPQEAKSMQALRKASLKGRRWSGPWAREHDWDKLGPELFQTGSPSEHSIDLQAPLTKVAMTLTKVLRPDRETLHVLRIGQGKIEEVRTEAFDEPEPEQESKVTDLHPAKEDKKSDKSEEVQEAALAKTGTDDEPAKAATLKKPQRGCPAPSFEQVTLRATKVLQAFLTPGQIDDFNRHQRFVTTGADTGHRYMLTSRNAPDELEHYGSRCVFDLDENTPFCVHDWDVPAEEELLTLHCLLSIPGYENWARGMPDRGYEA